MTHTCNCYSLTYSGGSGFWTEGTKVCGYNGTAVIDMTCSNGTWYSAFGIPAGIRVVTTSDSASAKFGCTLLDPPMTPVNPNASGY